MLVRGNLDEAVGKFALIATLIAGVGIRRDSQVKGGLSQLTGGRWLNTVRKAKRNKEKERQSRQEMVRKAKRNKEKERQ